jgi:hypothetical protein
MAATSMVHVRGRQGGVELVHDFAIHLFQWFPGHADYLDSALVAWISKKTYSGKPVVLRRRLWYSAIGPLGHSPDTW